LRVVEERVNVEHRQAGNIQRRTSNKKMKLPR
jgi:hypothetical protein